MVNPNLVPPNFLSGRTIGLRKGVENQALLLGRNADARIFNRELQNARIVFRVARIASLDPKRNLAVIGEFDGIAEEIDNYRAQPTGIARDPTRDRRRHDAFQLQIVLAGTHGHCSDRAAEHVRQIEADVFQAKVPHKQPLGVVISYEGGLV